MHSCAGFETPVELPPQLPVPLTLALAVSQLRVLLIAPNEAERAEEESYTELAWADMTDLQVEKQYDNTSASASHQFIASGFKKDTCNAPVLTRRTSFL